MAKKIKSKTEKLEREYTIPLRIKWKKVPRYKRANKAIKTIKQFLVRHMKIRDGDLNKIKIDKFLNESIWFRGIKKPPAKIKIKAIQEGSIVKAELYELSKDMKFKKARIERISKKAVETMEKKKSTFDKLKEVRGQKGEGNKIQKTEETVEEKEEKKEAVVEQVEKIEKMSAIKAKHTTEISGKKLKQKHQQRKALQK